MTAISAALLVPGCSKEPGGAGAESAAFNNDIGVSGPASLPFAELSHASFGEFAVADGHAAQVLISWGDPIFEGVGKFDPLQQSGESQNTRFGFNNDFIGFVSLPLGSTNSDNGLLVVNHEYASTNMMFPGSPNDLDLTPLQVDVDIAAHGLSVVEIEKSDGDWKVVLTSPFNRRITPLTPMAIAGPAARSNRLKTIISHDGVHTLGTYGNCSGGVTPWGTILTGEENVNGYFAGDYKKTSEVENYKRFGMFSKIKGWGDHYDRWNLDKNPNELLHVGWVVEIDPYNPDSIPKKRTALGRCKHEGCNVYVNADNYVVAYTGDDQIFEYIYKFVSKHQYDAGNRANNLELLDEGTLYVARFNSDGTLTWLPLVFGVGPLAENNGFFSQADVCIDSRKASDLVGATPMDRPEDVEVNAVNGHVFAMLTNNTNRRNDQVDEANSRAFNGNGQIVEFWPEDNNHRAETFLWDIFLLAGKPGKVDTMYHPSISEFGWLSCPDNCAFDSLGNLWIATDGGWKSGIADGVWACEVEGEHRALTKHFLSCPVGSELCGPFFTPDDLNFFVSIQHPGERSTYDEPDTRWPDFDPELPPRSSVVVITKNGGGRVGS
ncbi:MAG: secreted PhoX family phosphatase [Lentisphaeria bacterium]|jgi:secreted PhoX family phosphatase